MTLVKVAFPLAEHMDPQRGSQCTPTTGPTGVINQRTFNGCFDPHPNPAGNLWKKQVVLYSDLTRSSASSTKSRSSQKWERRLNNGTHEDVTAAFRSDNNFDRIGITYIHIL